MTEKPTLSPKPTGPQKSTDLPPVDLFDYLLLIPFITWFAGTLLLYEVIQRLALLISPRLHEQSVVGLNSSLLFALKLAGVSFKIEYRYQPPVTKPLILISNHQSLFDIPLLHHTFVTHYPRYIAKKELVTRWIPSVSFNLVHGGNGIIDRSDPRQALPEIKRVGELTNSTKRAITIFPEGTRGRDGRLKTFKAGGLSALLRGAADAEIIPVTIDNSWKIVARKFGPIPRGIEVKVIVNAPLDRTKLEKADQVADAVHEIIQRNLADIRSVSLEAVLAPPRPEKKDPD